MIYSYLDYSEEIRIEFELDNDVTYKVKYESCVTSSFFMKHLEGLLLLDIRENIISLWVGNQRFIVINKTTMELTSLKKLTSFETRCIYQLSYQSIPLIRNNNITYKRLTDFHTHFTGAPEVSELIRLGIKHSVKYPIVYLKKMGIDLEKYDFDGDSIQIDKLSNNDLLVLAENLKISIKSIEIFEKMENVYTYREPFTKRIELFYPILCSIANRYKNDGVKYVELSFSEFLKDYRFLDLIHEYIPMIERDYGVSIRFLAGIRRSAPLPDMLDRIDRIIAVANSPFIVGCDFMGHETNSVYEFKEAIQKICVYIENDDNDFVLRIHAGETASLKENVLDAVRIIDECFRTSKFQPNIRIGHGLYGVTDDVIEIVKKYQITIEFNLSSNLALNNVNDITEFPIKKYLKNGVSVVLGSDGEGLYSTYGNQEVILASAAGVTEEDFLKIGANERKLIQRSKKREETKEICKNSFELFNTIRYSTPTGEKRYSDSVRKKYQDDEQNHILRLLKRLNEIGAITNISSINEVTRGRIPVLISGASKKSYPYIDIETQEYIERLADIFVSKLDDKKAYLVTGGTNYGVEKLFHTAVKRKNSSGGRLVTLGTFTLEAEPSGIEPNTVTHGILLKQHDSYVTSWNGLPSAQLAYIKQNNGILIAIGGGDIVKDMIQMAYNMQIPMFLMDRVTGASQIKSQYFPDCSFTSSMELFEKIKKSGKDIFR